MGPYQRKSPRLLVSVLVSVRSVIRHYSLQLSDTPKRKGKRPNPLTVGLLRFPCVSVADLAMIHFCPLAVRRSSVRSPSAPPTYSFTSRDLQGIKQIRPWLSDPRYDHPL